MISQKETTNTTHTPMTSFQAMCTCPESVKKKKKKKKKRHLTLYCKHFLLEKLQKKLSIVLVHKN